MGRRRNLGSVFDGGQVGEVDQSTLRQLDEAAFGEIKKAERGRLVATPLPIDDIKPDPVQPRRTIPSAMRPAFSGGTTKGLNAWIREAREECLNRDVTPIDLDTLISKETEDANGEIGERDYGPIAGALAKVAALARSIKRDGLINPITVARNGRQYTIETGERRWLAYQLLRAQYGDDYSRIPAQVVESADLWRQAVENNSRDDLNQIGRARQLSLLLMDLLQDRGEVFQAYGEFERDRDFYAQVADARIPRGTADDVANAMGLQSTQTLRVIKRYFGLPADEWDIADDYGWTRADILDRLQRIQDAQRRQREEGDSVVQTTVSGGKPPSPSATHAGGGGNGSFIPGTGRLDVVAGQGSPPTPPRKQGGEIEPAYAVGDIVMVDVQGNGNFTVADITHIKWVDVEWRYQLAFVEGWWLERDLKLRYSRETPPRTQEGEQGDRTLENKWRPAMGELVRDGREELAKQTAYEAAHATRQRVVDPLVTALQGFDHLRGRIECASLAAYGPEAVRGYAGTLRYFVDWFIDQPGGPESRQISTRAVELFDNLERLAVLCEFMSEHGRAYEDEDEVAAWFESVYGS